MRSVVFLSSVIFVSLLSFPSMAKEYDAIVRYIEENDPSQAKAAEIMGVQRSRIGDVCRGKMSGFTIDALVSMAARAGLYPLTIAA